MLRLVFSPRWIAWHLLTLGAMAVSVRAAVWQWDRAGSAMGSALNVGYGLQWPVFAVFFGYVWWRFLRLEIRRLNGGPAETDEGPADGTDGEAESALEGGAPEPAFVGVQEPPTSAASGPAPWESGRSPFTRTPVRAPVPEDDEESPARAEYNRMLAELAAADRRAEEARRR